MVLRRSEMMVRHQQTQHWNGNVVILTKSSSLAATKVVKMTTFGATSDENFVKMTTFLFQGKMWRCSNFPWLSVICDTFLQIGRYYSWWPRLRDIGKLFRQRYSDRHLANDISKSYESFSWMKTIVFQCEFCWIRSSKSNWEKSQHWLRELLGTEQTLNHYLNQWWHSSLTHVYIKSAPSLSEPNDVIDSNFPWL